MCIKTITRNQDIECKVYSKLRYLSVNFGQTMMWKIIT